MNDIWQNFTTFDLCPSIEVGAVKVLWLPPSQVVAPQELDALLAPEEKSLAATYKAKTRRFEYERARWLIRKSTGWRGPLGRQENGAPRWPEGIVGSMTHKDGFVGLSLTPISELQGIGIDAEDPLRMQAGFRERLLVPEEISHLGQYEAATGLSEMEVMTAIFSFKESLFKCLYPLGAKMFYFHEAKVTTMAANGLITGQLLCDAAPQTPSGSIVTGAFNFIASEGRRICLTCSTLGANHKATQLQQ